MSEALRKLLKEGKTPQQHQDITPHVGVLTLHFQLYGCEDIKAKRKAFTAMKAIWGKEPDLAVAETADQEALDCATWTIAALGASAQQITQRLDQVEKDIEDRIDAAFSAYEDLLTCGWSDYNHGFESEGCPPPQPTRVPDTLHSRQFASFTDVLGEGEQEGSATASKLGY